MLKAANAAAGLGLRVLPWEHLDGPRSLGASVIAIEKVCRNRISRMASWRGVQHPRWGPQDNVAPRAREADEAPDGKQTFLAFADWGPGNQKVYISDVQQQGSRPVESLRFRRRRESDE